VTFVQPAAYPADCVAIYLVAMEASGLVQKTRLKNDCNRGERSSVLGQSPDDSLNAELFPPQIMFPDSQYMPVKKPRLSRTPQKTEISP